MSSKDHLLPLSISDKSHYDLHFNKNKSNNKNPNLYNFLSFFSKNIYIVKGIIFIAIITCFMLLISKKNHQNHPIVSSPQGDNTIKEDIQLVHTVVSVPISNRITILEQKLQNVINGNHFKEQDSLDFLETEAHSSTPGLRIVEARNFESFYSLIGSCDKVKTEKIASIISACLLNNKAAIDVVHRLYKEGKLDLLLLSLKNGRDIFYKRQVYTNWMVIWRRLLSIVITIISDDPLGGRGDFDLKFFEEMLPLLEDDVIEKQLSFLILLSSSNEDSLILEHIKLLPPTYEYNDLSKEIFLPFCLRMKHNLKIKDFCNLINK